MLDLLRFAEVLRISLLELHEILYFTVFTSVFLKPVLANIGFFPFSNMENVVQAGYYSR